MYKVEFDLVTERNPHKVSDMEMVHSYGKMNALIKVTEFIEHKGKW